MALMWALIGSDGSSDDAAGGWEAWSICIEVDDWLISRSEGSGSGADCEGCGSGDGGDLMRDVIGYGIT